MFSKASLMAISLRCTAAFYAETSQEKKSLKRKRNISDVRHAFAVHQRENLKVIRAGRVLPFVFISPFPPPFQSTTPLIFA